MITNGILPQAPGAGSFRRLLGSKRLLVPPPWLRMAAFLASRTTDCDATHPVGRLQMCCGRTPGTDVCALNGDRDPGRWSKLDIFERTRVGHMLAEIDLLGV